MREDKLCDDIHSIITVHGSLYHHNKVVEATYSRLLDNDLFEWNQTDVPKPEWKLLTYAILDQTMGMNLRGRLPENNSADVSRVHLDRRISDQLAKVTLFLNGDCRQKKLSIMRKVVDCVVTLKMQGPILLQPLSRAV